MVLVIYPNWTRVKPYKTVAHHTAHQYWHLRVAMPSYHEGLLPPKTRNKFTYTQMNKILQMWQYVVYDSTCTVK